MISLSSDWIAQPSITNCHQAQFDGEFNNSHTKIYCILLENTLAHLAREDIVLLVFVSSSSVAYLTLIESSSPFTFVVEFADTIDDQG